MKLKLKEILWEITPKCNKNCSYCGSKSIKDKVVMSNVDMLKVADEIAKYPPESLTFTGGEPGTICKNLLFDIIKKLSKANIKVRVVSNGAILDMIHSEEDQKRFEVIGISINSTQDIEAIKYKLASSPLNNEDNMIPQRLNMDAMTMITNFGKHNIFDFDKLAEYADSFGIWQIQLTEGNDLQLNSDGIEYFWDKVRDCRTSYVLADNAQQEHECSAGISGCAITYNGFVIPCLSKRSWGNCEFGIDENDNQGNILGVSLKEIWEKGFSECRFCDNKCCRDFVDYPKIKQFVAPIMKKNTQSFPPNGTYIPGSGAKVVPVYGVKIPYDIPRTVLYGTFPRDQEGVYVYSAFPPVSVTYYAVISGKEISEIGNIAWTTSTNIDPTVYDARSIETDEDKNE